MRTMLYLSIIGLGMIASSYVVGHPKVSCQWTILGYQCPPAMLSQVEDQPQG